MKPRLCTPLNALAFVWGLVSWFAASATAHTLPISYLTVVPDADYLHLEVTFNPFELTFFSELDRNRNGRLDTAEWEAQQAQITQRLVECLKLRVDDKLIAVETAGLTPDVDSHHATLRAHYRVDARRAPVSLESTLVTLTSGSHFSQVTFGREGRTQTARLDQQSSRVTFAPLESSPAAGVTRDTGGAFKSVGLPSLLLVGAVALGLGLAWFARRHILRGRSLRPS
ncbi:MAG: hypothetical protein HYY24_05390 [Verrucomicrobia bacterium]|nr:hypothetical protein [Verrucomicrobiota bacterium]